MCWSNRYRNNFNWYHNNFIFWKVKNQKKLTESKRWELNFCYVSIIPDLFHSVQNEPLLMKTAFLMKTGFLCRAGLERFLFPLRTERYIYYLALTSMNKLLDQRNHTQLSISGLERIGRYRFQKQSDPTAIWHNNHAEQ